VRYIIDRLKALARQLPTPRGLLILTIVVGGIVVVVAQSPWTLVAGSIGLAALAMLFLLTAARQREDHERIKILQSRSSSQQPVLPAVHRVGPSDESEREERVQRARAIVGRARQQSVITDHASRREFGGRTSRVLAPQAEPLITVVVPCFNEERFVGDTLESLRRQRFTDWECIVVDDASTDGSLAEIWRYAKVDERIRVIRHKVNSGLSASRNTGLRAARGAYVTFLDADDMLMADSLLERAEMLAAIDDDAVAGVYCGVQIVGEAIDIDALPPTPRSGPEATVDFVSSGHICPFTAHAPLLRTDVVRGMGGFDESMHHGAEDWDLWYRLMRGGYRFVGTGSTSAIYRQKERSMAKVMSYEHVAEASRLTDRAYEPMSVDNMVESAPCPLTAPKQEYERLVTIGRRTVRYATIALLAGDADAAERLIAEMEPVPSAVRDVHLTSEQAIASGFRRSLGLSDEDLELLRADLAPLEARMLDLLGRIPSADVQGGRKPPSVDVLFAPQTAEMCSMMVEVARRLDEASYAFLDLERVTGASGVQSVLKANAVDASSLNQWVLNSGHARALVVAFPRDGAIEELSALITESGGSVVELTRPEDVTMRVEDTPSYATPTIPATREDAVAVIGSALAVGAPSVDFGTPNDDGRLAWVAATEMDPDNVFAVEENPDTRFDATDVARFKDRHKGERCVIIGTGPSLNEVDLRELAGEATIGVNGIFYAADKMGFDPTYYVVEDTLIMRDNVDRIREYAAGHKFFPSIYRDAVGEAPNVTYFMMNRGFHAPRSPAFCVPRFSTDAAQRIYSGQSVTTINLQLAYYMGFTEVVLIGMDFSYTTPKDASVEGDHILSQGDDPNHFHPDYFGKGKVWKNPKLDRALANYQLAKLMFEADGRRIVNATPGGKLEVFERIDYQDLFG
jgi:GT2 family glycosyltransferase